jgi:hypothetical protein
MQVKVYTRHGKLAAMEGQLMLDRLEGAMRRQAVFLEGDMKRKLRANGSIATAKLWQSVHAGVSREANSLTMYIQMLKHGLWVELGRKPGKQPPLAAIVEWVKRKHIMPSAKQVRDAGGSPREQAFINMAFAIRRTWSAKRGHPIPLEAVIRWMDERDIKPTAKQAAEAQARSIAYKIGKRGIKPRPFIGPAVKRIWRQVRQDIGLVLAGGKP